MNRLVTRSRIEGLVMLLVAGAYLWEAQNVPAFYKLPGVPGPTTFPVLLGVIFAFCGLWMLVSPGEIKRAARAPAAAPEAHDRHRPGPIDRLAEQWHLCAMWAIILAFLIFMPELGFPAAAFLLLALFIVLLGERRWSVAAGFAFVATLLIYAAFKIGLNVRLPLGIIEGLLK